MIVVVMIFVGLLFCGCLPFSPSPSSFLACWCFSCWLCLRWIWKAANRDGIRDCVDIHANLSPGLLPKGRRRRRRIMKDDCLVFVYGVCCTKCTSNTTDGPDTVCSKWVHHGRFHARLPAGLRGDRVDRYFGGRSRRVL